MYYIGFFTEDLNKMLMFWSDGKPTKRQFPYFGKVIGPYGSEPDTKTVMRTLKKAYGYKENPCDCKPISASQIKRGTIHELEHTKSKRVSKKIACDHLKEDPKYYTHLAKMEKQYKKNVMSPEKALRLTRKVIAYAKDLKKDYQENPGQNYHDQKFLAYMKELEKYKIGSVPYIGTLAKAYEHLESAKDSR